MSKIELLSLKDGVGHVKLTIGPDEYEQDIFLPEDDNYKAKRIMKLYLKDYEVSLKDSLSPSIKKNHALVGIDVDDRRLRTRLKDLGQAIRRIF